MSLLPPPPLQAWPSMPVVWQRWFVELFRRAGLQTAGGLDEIESVVASIPERQSQSAGEARIDGLEEQFAGLTPPSLVDAAARLAALDGQLAGLTPPSLADVLARLGDIEGHLAGLAAPNLSDVLRRLEGWDDVQGSIALATGVSALTLEAYRDTPALLYHFRHNQDDALTFVYQLPHGWNPTTSVRPHIHWIPCADPAAPKVVRFAGQYAWTNPDTALPANASWTTFAVSSTVSPGDVFKEKITGLALIAPPSGFEESAILVVHVTRPGASDAADTYTTSKGTGTAAANVALLSSDTHCHKTKIGTFEEFPA